VAHNGSLIPVPGRDIEAQAWYQGGISIVDFTDPAQPSRLLISTAGQLIRTCWCSAANGQRIGYNATFYGSEIARGLTSLN